MTAGSRPWRAVASLRLGPGIRPIHLGHTSAATEAGLTAFVERHRASGAHVEVWEVQAIPEVAEVAQAVPTRSR